MSAIQRHTKRRGVRWDGESGVVIQDSAYERLVQDAEIGKALGKLPAGWSLLHGPNGWLVIDDLGTEQGYELTAYDALRMAGLAEEVW